MKIGDALIDIERVFLDTAPVIYYVEKNPRYAALVDVVFDQIDQGELTAVTSPITLAECLVYPYRQNNAQLQQDFKDLIGHGNNTEFVAIDEGVGTKAAELRAAYNIALPDALQIACALKADCDAFLSNDIALKRISEIAVLILDEYTDE